MRDGLPLLHLEQPRLPIVGDNVAERAATLANQSAPERHHDLSEAHNILGH